MSALADAANPLVRAQLGSDCVAEVDRKIAHLREETDAWREPALSTDRDDVKGVV